MLFDRYRQDLEAEQRLNLRRKFNKSFHDKRHPIKVFEHLIGCVFMMLKTFCPVSRFKPFMIWRIRHRERGIPFSDFIKSFISCRFQVVVNKFITLHHRKYVMSNWSLWILFYIKKEAGQKLNFRRKWSKSFHDKTNIIKVFEHLIICVFLILKTFCPASLNFKVYT